jgi:hypothetical protein
MMKGFLDHYRDLLAHRRPATVQVTGGLIAAILVTWFLLDVMLWIGFLGLIISAPLILWGSTYLPQLAWFWGPLARAQERTDAPATPQAARTAADPVATEDAAEANEVPPDDDDVEHVPIPDPETIIRGTPDREKLTTAPSCETVRTTPVGTQLITHRRDEAVLEVKSAIRFWCWAAPTLFGVGAIFGAPIGGFLGALAYDAHPQTWQQNFGAYVATGSVLATGGFILAAIWSYFATRPWVRVIIKPDRVKYGDRRFDRRYLHGIGLGYSNNETELKFGLLTPSFGVTAMAVRYGRWGEDLRYMVNSRYAPQIVIWMNEIIDSVGETRPPSRFEPMMGRKIELL